MLDSGPLSGLGGLSLGVALVAAMNAISASLAACCMASSDSVWRECVGLPCGSLRRQAEKNST
jgi:hypothetical protein